MVRSGGGGEGWGDQGVPGARDGLVDRVADDGVAEISRNSRWPSSNAASTACWNQKVEAAFEDGHRLFLEISAHPVVGHSINETVSGAGDTLVTPSLRRHRPERTTLLTSLAALHCQGVSVDWSVLQPAGNRTDPPTTAWQHARHWVDARDRSESPVDTLLGTETGVHGSWCASGRPHSSCAPGPTRAATPY